MKPSFWTKAAVLSGFVLLTGQTLAAVSEQQLRATAASVVADPKTGKARFIGFDSKAVAKQTLSAEAQRLPADLSAAQYLSDYGAFFGLRNTANETRTVKHKLLDSGRSSTRYQQYFQGLPVIGAELVVNQTAQRKISSISGKTSPDIELDTTPVITSAQAMAIARQAMTKWHGLAASAFVVPAPTLSIYDARLLSASDKPVALVWQLAVATQGGHPINEFIAIDAKNGSIALHFNQVPHAKNRETYDAANTEMIPGKLVCDERNPTCAGAVEDAVYAHTYAGTTYDFYYQNFGRDGIDGAGMLMKSTVRNCAPDDCPMGNAYWDPNLKQMVYGEGFTKGEDVVAHELTHGVTSFESNLYYYSQSGAINESLSDVFGEFSQQSNPLGTVTPETRWLLGEDLNIGAMRDLKNPPAFDNPDKMTSPYYHLDDSDRYGVHINSGINNKAAYLMVDGGAFNGRTVAPIGLTKTAKIYYRVQTSFLTSGSDYLDLYNALNQSCQDLMGTAGITAADCQAVRHATEAVEMNQPPIPGLNPKAAQCPAGQRVDRTLFSDNMESGVGQWTFASTLEQNHWGVETGFAASGDHALYGPGADNAADLSAAMAKSVALPANAQLWFNHAFEFETNYTEYFDGGVLEYSTNGGGSWTDASALFAEGQNYAGTLAPYNPLGARKAFVAGVLGYRSSRYDLASLAGKNVQFRWRIGADASVASFGWLVDDVNIHTCAEEAVTLPGAPTDVVATAGNRSATLAFNAPATNGGAAITGYSATCSSSNGIRSGSGAASPITVNGLINNNVYSCTVLALNRIGSSAPSASVVVAPVDCSYALNARSMAVGAGANFGNVTVSASGAADTASCRWTAVTSSKTDWLSVTSGSSYQGNASVSFSTEANTSTTPRSGSLMVAGQTFAVSQAGFTAPSADTDSDGDGIPDGVESTVGTNPHIKDNDIFNNPQLFAMQQYRDFEGREGNTNEILSLTQSIATGTITRGQAIKNLFEAPRFQDISAPLARLYFTYFLRIPDYEGLMYWTQKAKDGAPLQQISAAFALSEEFSARYGSLNNEQFVTLVYNNVLVRAPDASGKAYWLGLLNNGSITRGQVMLGFSESAEYKDASQNKVNVTLLYASLLHRSPDPSGFNNGVDRLNGGQSILSFIEGLISAPEYRQRFLP